MWDAGTILVALAVPVLMLMGMLGTVIVLLWKSARYVTRVELAADRIVVVEKRLEMIPSIETHLSLLGARVDRLEGRHESTRAHAIRAEAMSEHDGE